MATIQIRDLPEDAYEEIRRRARRAGRSIQSYMRLQVIELAAHPSADEAMAALAEVRDGRDTPGATRQSIRNDLAADRR
ncbi:MAG TPA: hypothetical protein VFQ01_11825 [Nocardioides sp.]|jgi:plasmid stability protein|nr:hypothetical protein [Nocardioides sp.]